MSLWRILLVLTLLVAGLARAETGGDTVPRFETARAQLQHARELRRIHRRAKGEARQSSRLVAVEAFEAVRLYHPAAHAAVAEGLFRAGELQRTAGEYEDAQRLFRSAADEPGAGTFGARARLESGHVHRRLEQFRHAVRTYDKLIRDRRAAPKYRDEATFWKARVFLEMGRDEDARSDFRGLAEGTEDPLVRIRAYDELALLALRTGDLEWSAGVLEECRKAIAGPLSEETSLGRRVRSAFRRMRCRSRLREAVKERRRAREQ